MKHFSDENASIETIKNILEAAAIDSQIDGDDDLYVTDGVDFPFWISLPADRKLIMFHTHVGAKNDAREQDLLCLVNRANSTIVLPQFFVVSAQDTRVVRGVYYLPYEYGIDTRLIVKIARQFAGAFKASGQLDENDLIP